MAKASDIETFVDEGLDFNNRTISFFESINRKSVSKVIRFLKILVETNPNAPIDFYICSPGGCVYSTFALYDAIRSCPCIVRTHAQGMIMSGGLIVFCAGDERLSYPNVTFMAHGASTETSGKEFEHKCTAESLVRSNRIMFQMLANGSNRDSSWWSKILKHEDYYFNYDEAVELGIVTREN